MCELLEGLVAVSSDTASVGSVFSQAIIVEKVESLAPVLAVTILLKPLKARLIERRGAGCRISCVESSAGNSGVFGGLQDFFFSPKLPCGPCDLVSHSE